MSSKAERDYLLGTDDEELRRLEAQHQTWQPETVDLWDRAGFGAGQMILDLGCGPGFTTLELAERVGPKGKVLAIDGSEKFTCILRQRVEALGACQVEVTLADVRSLDLPESSIDAVFARWLLCFLKEPQAVVEAVARALKMGGLFVVMDYYNYEAFAEQPGNPHFQRVFQAVYQSFGQGLDIGGKVPGLMSACDLEVVEVKEISGLARPGNRVWNWVAEFLDVYMPELVSRGLLREEDRRAHLEEWRERERDPQFYFLAPSMVGVIGAKI